MRTAFKPLVASAIEARRQILGLFAGVPREIVGAMAGVARAQGGTFRGVTAEAQRAFREQTRAARDAAREQREITRRAERAMLAEHSAALRERASLDRAADSLSRQRSRALEREFALSNRRQQAEIDSFARRTSHRASRFALPNMPIASMARRAGAEVLRGYGVDPTISGAFQRNVTLERLSQEASNSARLAGQTVSPGAVEQRVRDVSTRRGMGREDAASGVFGFQKLTGDLTMGLSLLDKMAERSAATATSVTDYAAAMGNVSNALGDIPNKEQRILEIMDAITVQGARGAVEVSDMATQMARVAAAAGKFGGDKGENIKMAGALVQMARAEGGAPSAAEASRSVVGFANNFQKSARLAAFEKITGKSAFTDSGKTQLRGMRDLVKDSLLATGGNREEMNKIFMDVIGARAVETFTKAFNAAGGGEKGIAAMDAKVAGLTNNTTLSQSTLDELNAQRENTQAAKVQRFQNTMDDVAQKVQVSLLPALERLAPVALTVAEVLGSLAKIGLENPGMAIVTAIVASIGRAGLESAFRAAIERGIQGTASAAGGGGRFMGGMAMGAIGLGLGSALATGIYAEGVASADASDRRITKAGHLQSELMTLSAGPTKVSGGKREELRRRVLDEEEELKAMETRRSGVFGNDFFDMAGQWDHIKGVFGASNTDTEIKSRRTALMGSRAELAKIEATRPETPTEVSRYVAKDPKTTQADMRAAFDKGGTAELEKIATLQSKQDNTAQLALKEQQSTNTLLGEIRDKLASGRDPTVPFDESAGYQ